MVIGSSFFFWLVRDRWSIVAGVLYHVLHCFKCNKNLYAGFKLFKLRLKVWMFNSNVINHQSQLDVTFGHVFYAM